MLESIQVHFYKESGMSFAKIAEKTGLQLAQIPTLYVKALTANKKYESDKLKEPVVYRKRYNKNGSRTGISKKSLDNFKESLCNQS